MKHVVVSFHSDLFQLELSIIMSMGNEFKSWFWLHPRKFFTVITIFDISVNFFYWLEHLFVIVVYYFDEIIFSKIYTQQLFLCLQITQLLNSSSQASSGYQSNFTGSSVSLDTQNISGKLLFTLEVFYFRHDEKKKIYIIYFFFNWKVRLTFI